MAGRQREKRKRNEEIQENRSIAKEKVTKQFSSTSSSLIRQKEQLRDRMRVGLCSVAKGCHDDDHDDHEDDHDDVRGD